MIKEIIRRLKAETPSFFRKLRRLSLIVSGLGTTLEAIPSQHLTWLPANTAGMLITVGAVATFLTSLPTKEPTDK